MKKVINTEEIDPKEVEKSRKIVRSLKAAYLATLILAGAYFTYDYLNRPKQVQAEESVEYDELADYECSEYTIIEDNQLATLEVGSVTMDIIDPGKGPIPLGYSFYNGLCYKFSCEGEAPEGYIKAEDDKTLIRLDDSTISPEGYLIVGDKAIGVANPKNKTVNGYRYFTLPKGYILIGNIGVGIFEYQKERQKALKLR